MDDFALFADHFLNFINTGLQAIIIARNEVNYHFLQYKEDGNYAITRSLNSQIMLSARDCDASWTTFKKAIEAIRDIAGDQLTRHTIIKFIYTCQQAIGATLDSLPAGKSNFARKLNGDLFEHFIREIISDIGINVASEMINIPLKRQNAIIASMLFQHDLVIKDADDIRAIGSVKTSSKDRLSKIFLDRIIYNKLSGKKVPHFAIFLNDVQRKGKEPAYGIHSTFLAGHFKCYTVALSPLAGVYYCDLRPEMKTDKLLAREIKSIDHLLVEDIWKF